MEAIIQGRQPRALTVGVLSRDTVRFFMSRQLPGSNVDIKMDCMTHTEHCSAAALRRSIWHWFAS